jgi:hypothetical protein
VRLFGGGVEWIHLAQDRDCWRAVVNAMMSPRVLALRSELVSSECSVKAWDGIVRHNLVSLYPLLKVTSLLTFNMFLTLDLLM